MAIEVTGRERYYFNNRVYPRGWGRWGFKIAGNSHWFTGLYTQAKAKAVRYARKNHPKVTSIELMP